MAGIGHVNRFPIALGYTAQNKLAPGASQYVRKEITLKYDASQLRDDHGRWTAGGAASAGKGAVKAYWNKTHGLRHAEGAVAAGALAAVSGSQTGGAIKHGLQGHYRKAATGAAVAIGARTASQAISKRVDPTRLNRALFTGSKITTGFLLNPFGRAVAKYGAQGAMRGFKPSPGTRGYVRGNGTSGTQYAPPGVKTKAEMPKKPIIQIAMEMQKHLADKKNGKASGPFKPKTLLANNVVKLKRPNYPKQPVQPQPVPQKPAPSFHLHLATTAPKKKKEVADSEGVKDHLTTCPDCGAKVSKDTKICPKCGYAMKEIVAWQFVFKDAKDDYRWVLLSSNGFRDRDRELITTKALEQDVAMWELMGRPAQPLRFWHIPLTDDYSRGIELGMTDFRMVHNHTLIESGTFLDPVIGEAVFKAQDKLAASVGFRHSPNEPNSDKMFTAVQIFERSLLPREKASNPLTHLFVN